MTAGMIFAALAFCAAALVEVNVVKTVVEPAPKGHCLVQVYNLAKGDVAVKIPGSDLFQQPIRPLQDPDEYQTLPLGGVYNVKEVDVLYKGNSFKCNSNFTEVTAYSLIIHDNGTTGIQCKLVEDNIHKSKTGDPRLRFLNTQPEALNVTVGDHTFNVPPDYGVSGDESVDRNVYSGVEVQSKNSIDLGLLDFGASYTLILTKESGKITVHRMEDVKANNIHIAWQIPQYVLITAGEVMFSVTGLEFSYSQAPANMKSVLQAGWLLTVAFGNIIVLIVAEGAGLEQWAEFLLFAGLLVAVSIIFAIMAYFYTYVDPDQLEKLSLREKEKEEEDDDDLKKEQTDDVHLNKIDKTTKL